MAPGDKDPKPEEGRVLSPEELDISDDDHVEQLDEGRYVVSPDVRTDSVTSTAEPSSAERADPEETSRTDTGDQAFTDAAVHEWLEADLADTNSRYGFDVTAKFDGTVSQQQMVSNDIVTVFESLMLWYTRQVDGDTPVEEVLGILLSESNVPVKYPPSSVERLVRSTDLSRDDSIAELIETVGEDDVNQR